jgi:SAM-dependent methyltransferase
VAGRLAAKRRLAWLRHTASVRARRAIPARAKPVLRRVLDVVDVFAAWSLRRSAPWPVPPRRLRARVGAPGARPFVESGRAAADAIRTAAADAGTPLERAEAILDFGCGCGRVLFPLDSKLPSQVRLTGCDVDAQAIRWLDARLSARGRAVVNSFAPPLPFADAAFDVVYSSSILTHLDQASQDRWIAELDRVLSPDGLALVSIHGPRAFAHAVAGHARLTLGMVARLRAYQALDDFVFEPYDSDRATREELPGITGAYGMAFQTPAVIGERWQAAFELGDNREWAINHWQDLVVLRKR